jgi:SAM-dependent methyltransferase
MLRQIYRLMGATQVMVSTAPQAGFSDACERNKNPILGILRTTFNECTSVLEIGSGTGQHAVYFAEQLPHLFWQPSDTVDYLPGLRARVDHNELANLKASVELDVRMPSWPVDQVSGIFTANSLHFMAESCAQELFRGVGEVLEAGGTLVVYGPFRYQAEFTSESNARFDQWLKQTDPVRGIRDFEWVNELAVEQGLDLQSDTAMPANNQVLVWQRAP